VAFTRESLRELASDADQDGEHRPGRNAADPTGQRDRLGADRDWKESKDPGFNAELDRIQYGITHIPQQCFTSDQFGLPSINIDLRRCPRVIS